MSGGGKLQGYWTSQTIQTLQSCATPAGLHAAPGATPDHLAPSDLLTARANSCPPAGLPNRDATNDQVTVDAAEAIKVRCKSRRGVECARLEAFHFACQRVCGGECRAFTGGHQGALPVQKGC